MRKKNLKTIYNEVSKITDRSVKLPKTTRWRSFYELCLKSSFIKLLEYNEFIHSTRKNEFSFLYMATLRGICEDFIILTFLSKFNKRDREKLIRILLFKQLEETIEAQTIFFAHNRPQQWVIMHTKTETKEHLTFLSKEVEKINKKLGLRDGKRLPSVKEMATYSGLSDLYAYLYHATSKVVHFSPHVLMRMGWGDLEKGPIYISSKHFFSYYRAFNKFYGSFLFIKYVDEFQKELRLLKKIIQYKDIIEDVINKEKRWPELVTFEEMNLDLEKFEVFMPAAIKMVVAREDYSIDKSTTS